MSICGAVTNNNFSQDFLENMFLSMKNRTNEDGRFIKTNNRDVTIGFACNNISRTQSYINDEIGENKYIIVSDASIYNIDELKRKLSIIRINLSVDEIIIQAYIKWGYDCVNYFNGDFAFAIYDIEKEELFCARDHLGIKPFYYFFNKETFVFATELKALLKVPFFNKKINTSCLNQLFIQRYIHAPNTIFEDTFKLEPGTRIIYKKGILTKVKYYDIVAQYFLGEQNLITDYADAKLQLKDLLFDAVKIRQGDEKVGTFLSGGIDSTLMTVLTQIQNNVPIKSFSIGFDTKRYNEAIYAKEIAEVIGTDHTELYIGEKEIVSIIDEIPTYYDEPYGDESQVASMYASVLAKQNGIDVVITGDGGDEQFCGYPSYLLNDIVKKYDEVGNVLFNIANPIKATSYLPRKLRLIINNRDIRTKTQCSANEYSNYMNKHLFVDRRENVASFPIEDLFPIDNWMMRAMLVDMQTLVPGVIVKVERAAAFAQISTRSPLLDYRVNQLAFKFPFEFKYKDGMHKRILKDILYEHVPKNLLERPKQGFSIDEARWLRGALKKQLLEFTEKTYLEKQGIFNPDTISKDIELFFRNKRNNLGGSRFYWTFFMFQLWYQRYVV